MVGSLKNVALLKKSVAKNSQILVINDPYLLCCSPIPGEESKRLLQASVLLEEDGAYRQPKDSHATVKGFSTLKWQRNGIETNTFYKAQNASWWLFVQEKIIPLLVIG